MGETTKPEVGTIGWIDLTVPNADVVRDFYRDVVGWKPADVDMGGYSDYNMTQPDSGAPAAGVCWSRGSNANLPPYWLVYITVADIDESIRRCTDSGGKIIEGPKDMGAQGRYCIIQDPAGAYAALFQSGE